MLVLGSSIAKPIHQGLFGGRSFFNASIFGGSLEEMIAMYELAWECGIRPSQVVLQADTTLLGKRRAPPSTLMAPLLDRACVRLHLGEEAARHAYWIDVLQAFAPGEPAGQTGGAATLLMPYDTLLSPAYFQYCVRRLGRSLESWQSGQQSGIIEQFADGNRHLMYPDGSIEWCQVFLDETPDRIRQATGKTPPAEFLAASMQSPEPDRCRLFEAFVSSLLESGVAVEIFLPPSYPWLFDQAQQAGKSLPSTAAEAFVRKIAERRGLKVDGSLDPRRAGVREEDFVDFVHLRREAIDRLFKSSPLWP